jgi:5,10-methenyltetrahydrofolate synthetase
MTHPTSISRQHLSEAQEQAENKAVLRKRLLAARAAIGAEDKKDWDRRLGEALLAWCAGHEIKCLGVYWPIRGEPDLREVYARLAARGIGLALPVVQGKEAPLAYYAWKPKEEMDKDAYGIAIPKQRDAAIKPDVVLVPCVGYNRENFRLGYGGGFYDRTLHQEPRPYALGIAYCCGLAAFAAEAHDLPLQEILTEEN